MPIRDKKRVVDDFEIPERVYTDTEIRDFHQKIQRFWGEPRQVEVSKVGPGTAQKFDHEALAVAYGAANKVQHGLKFVYLYNSERYRQFANLWNSYEAWRKKQDWIENKRGEDMEKIAESVPF